MDLSDLLRMGKQYLSDAMPGGSLNPEVTRQSVLDGAAMAASPVPVLGDLLGLGADANRYATDPESRTPLNFGLTALGALPFVPAMAGIFAGKGAKTADLAKQGLAEQMLKAGDDPAKVWSQTGWGIGPDGKWRFEIPDNAARINESKPIGGNEWVENDIPNVPGVHPVGKVFDDRSGYGLLKHGPLSLAYSSDIAPNANVVGNSSLFNSLRGGFDPVTRNVSIAGGLNSTDAKSTTLHELQHAIQQREGFARGGSPETFSRISESAPELTRLQNQLNELRQAKQWTPEIGKKATEINNAMKALMDDPFASYQRLAGEAEARLTQARMNMDAPQRAASYPWEPQYFEGATGVRLGDLINRFD